MINGSERESQSTTKCVRKTLLGGRHVSAPILGHYQVSKKYLMRKLYSTGGKVVVHDKLQRDLVV
jgi:hypothetical protein